LLVFAKLYDIPRNEREARISGAFYPASIMPFWLPAVDHANPLTYEVDALRALMLMGGTSSLGW
jgi:ABC-type multidrug transport system permease subunit